MAEHTTESSHSSLLCRLPDSRYALVSSGSVFPKLLPRLQKADEFVVFAGLERCVCKIIDHKELDLAKVANLCAVASKMSLW